MVVREEIQRLKDEFVELYTDYKSKAAAMANPPPVVDSVDPTNAQHPASHDRKDLDDIVDSMLQLMFQIVRTLLPGPANGCQDLPLIKAEPQSDADEESDSSANVNDDDDDELSNSSSSGSSSDESKDGSGSGCDNLSDVSSEPEEEAEPEPTSVKKARKKRTPIPPGPIYTNPSQRLKHEAFKKAAAEWLESGIPRLSDQKQITAEQKRDVFNFDLTHRALGVSSSEIFDHVVAKYGIGRSTYHKITRDGQNMQTFQRKKGPKMGRPRRSKIPDDVGARMVEYARANPFNTTATEIHDKFSSELNSSYGAVRMYLQRAGIKLLTSQDRRAIKLNMQGKDYKPFFTPEAKLYHKIRDREKYLMKKQGIHVDGRRMRGKDPTWKSWKEQAGLPDGVIVYNKEYHTELMARPRMDSTPFNRDSARTSSGVRRKRPNKNKSRDTLAVALVDERTNSTTTTYQDERPAHATQHQRQPTSSQLLAQHASSSWQIGFDVVTGNLYNSQGGGLGQTEQSHAISSITQQFNHQPNHQYYHHH